MKTLLLLIIASPVALTAIPSLAAELELIVPSHISLTAQLVSNAAKAVDYFKTDYGSSDIHTAKSRTIAGSVRNFGKEPAEVIITTEWFCKGTGGNHRYVSKMDTSPQQIRPGATYSFQSNSGTVVGRDQKLVMIGSRTTEGARIDGWVVTVREKLPAPPTPTSPAVRTKVPTSQSKLASPPILTGSLLAVKGSDAFLEDIVRGRK